MPQPDRRNLGWIVAALFLGVILGILGLLGSAWLSID
jgi:hypothetical protein